MDKKFHITSNGDVKPCSAVTGTCPYGKAEEHYPSPETAREAFEASMSSKVFSKSVKTVNGVPMPKQFYHLTTRRNLESIRAWGLTPAVGDRSSALGESESRIYLFDSKESVMDALGNWLGEEFDEDEELILLSIPADSVEKPLPSFEDPEGSWEWSSNASIKPEFLTEEPDELN